MVSFCCDVAENLGQVIELEEEEDFQYEAEEVDVIHKIIVRFYHKDHENLKFKSLVFAVGETANLFVNTYLQLDDPIGCIEAVYEQLDASIQLSYKQKDYTSNLYESNGNVVCLTRNPVKPKDCFAWLNKVLSQISAEVIIALVSVPRSRYMQSSHMEDDTGLIEGTNDLDILRHLKTKNYTEASQVALLEQANVVQDLPAAILTHCELREVPSILYMSFAESHFIDGFSLKTFKPILKETHLCHLQIASPSIVQERLSQFEGYGVAGDNLYI